MYLHNNSKTAFSLIEASIVLIVIGLISFIVIGASTLRDGARLKVAQQLTKSSPVSSMKNLVIWYEATSKESFEDGVPANEAVITKWNDITPNSGTSNDTVAGQGVYVKNFINGLPALRFQYNDGFTFDEDGSIIANSNLTFFIVEKSVGFDENNSTRGIIGSYGNKLSFSYYSYNSSYYYLLSGISNKGRGRLHYLSNSNHRDLFNKGANIPRLFTLTYDGDRREIWLNGTRLFNVMPSEDPHMTDLPIG